MGCGVERVDIGEQNQRVGTHHVRDERGKPVVVAETDLVAGKRIVLVDYRHHTEFEQLGHGAPRIAVLPWLHRVFGGDEQLAHANAVAAERHLVLGHEQPLPHRRGRLLCGHIGGARFEAERLKPAAMAPDETSTMLPPSMRTCAIAPTSALSLSTSKCPDGCVSELDPTFTTTVRAAATARRTSSWDGVCIAPLTVLLGPSRCCFLYRAGSQSS